MQNPQLYGSDIRFDSQLNYTNAILTKLQELQFSLRMGKDCSSEMSNLLYILTDGIRKPIDSKLEEIRAKHAIKINEIRRMTKYPTSTFVWSGKHKARYRGVLINREQSDALREMIPVIVNRLDEMGLLLNREKQTQI